jgi:hypothetical protein
MRYDKSLGTVMNAAIVEIDAWNAYLAASVPPVAG